MASEPWRLVAGPLYPSPAHPLPGILRRWLTRIVIVLVVGGLLLVGARPGLEAVAYAFRVDDPAPSDVIVVLLGGLSHRPFTAAELYKQKLAPRIVFCQIRKERDDIVSETDRTKQLLIENGVRPEDIEILPGTVASTRDEAVRIEEHWKETGRKWKSVTIVTSAFHTARSRWIFRRVFADPGIAFHMASAEHPKFNEANWYKKEDGLIFYLNEFIKTVFYRLRY